MNIQTEMYTTQDNEEIHDVDCIACYENDMRQWKKSLSLDKYTARIDEVEIYQFSPNENTSFVEVNKNDIPNDILECLEGRVLAAKDILYE